MMGLQKLETKRVLVFGRPVDMRNGFTGLAALVREGLGQNPLSGDLFVFLNRRGTLLKALFWDRTGFVLVAKRLERGTFRLRNTGERLEIDRQNFALLLDGIPAGARRIE